MKPSGLKVVYDCNIHLQALINPAGPSGACVDAAVLGSVRLFWSQHAADELRSVSEHPLIRNKFPSITPDRIDQYIINIERIAVTPDEIERVFVYERDPDDAHYIDLALAADASIVVTRDRDLLALMTDNAPASREFRDRFPHLRILTPPLLLAELRASSGDFRTA